MHVEHPLRVTELCPERCRDEDREIFAAIVAAWLQGRQREWCRAAARPTAAEAAGFSAFTQSLPAIGRLTPEEAADLLEDERGKLCDHGSTAALTTLKERQPRLRRQKRNLLETMEKVDDEA